MNHDPCFKNFQRRCDLFQSFWTNSRILLSQNEVTTDTNQEILPTLTIISLGGNDYNHQNGNVPSQEEFTRGKIITDLSHKGLKS